MVILRTELKNVNSCLHIKVLVEVAEILQSEDTHTCSALTSHPNKELFFFSEIVKEQDPVGSS